MSDNVSQPLEDPLADTTSQRAADLDEQIAEIAAAVAELRAAQVAQSVSAEVAGRRIRPFEAVMVALLAISLLVHALTIGRLLSVRNTLRGEVDRLAASVEAAKQSRVRYDLPIDQQIPIDIDVPINTEVRINQTLNLPVQTALGSFDIPVPIDTTIPVSTTVPIAFDQTVNISTTVPLRLDVPVQIDLGSEQIAGYLDRLHAALLDLRERL